jgi:hypothetical protein
LTVFEIFYADTLEAGPSAKRVGHRHRRVLYRRPQLALGKGQPTVVNAFAESRGGGARHRWHLCRRPDGRAVSTVDSSPNVTVAQM